MEHLQKNNLEQLETQTLISKELIASLGVAEQRTDLKFKNIVESHTDVLNEFSNIPIDKIQKAIRNGSLGKYGQTYRLSTQEICRWIREYNKPKTTKLGI